MDKKQGQVKKRQDKMHNGGKCITSICQCVCECWMCKGDTFISLSPFLLSRSLSVFSATSPFIVGSSASRHIGGC